jgi:histidinol-phosphate aminotransferase
MTLPQPRPGILDIPMYVPGRSRLAGRDRVVKLSSNESALGTSDRAIAAYKSIADTLHRYPDGAATGLREAIARVHGAGGNGLDPSRVVCGEGSDEIIHLLAAAYAGPGDEILHTAQGFVMYRLAALGVGAVPVAAPERNYTPDVDALLERVGPVTRVVFLSNPNPTGTYVSAADVGRLHGALRDDILLVIDAAYAEYVTAPDYTSGLELAATADNVVMTRTFSKAYGLAGLRLGWCYAPLGVADVLNRLRGPFNVTAPAQAAGIAALDDQAFIERARSHNATWYRWLSTEIAALGPMVVPSVTNFICIGFDGTGRSADDALAHFMGDGVLVRDLKAYGLPNHLRVTIGLEEENRKVVDSLRRFLG